jgi:hypothetical protein
MWLTWIVVLSLVVYRVTRFLIEDPLIDAPRLWLRKRIVGNVVGVAVSNTKPWRAKLLELSECPYCLSVWVSAATVLVAAFTSNVPLPFWTWLAVCGGCMVVWVIVED